MFCLKKRQKLKNQLRLHNLKKKQKIVAVQANNLSTIKIDTDTTYGTLIFDSEKLEYAHLQNVCEHAEHVRCKNHMLCP